jgi:NAD(P)-dependent dehydrogenase (short-subunit alcohol dehydrogenase family)
MEDLAGRCAVITGAAGGIGYSIAEALGQEGMRLALADIDEARIEGAAAQLRDRGYDARGFTVDVSDQSSMDALRDQIAIDYGDVGVLCNNAGVSILHQPFLDSSPDDWSFVFGVNVFGVVNGMRAFLPAMLASGREHHVVNTASMSGLRASRASSVYVASKYSVVGLTESLAREMQSSDVGFSLLLPSTIITDLANTSQQARAKSSGQEISNNSLALIDGDMDATFVGPLVVAGIRSKSMYILTHPTLWNEVANRHDAIADAFKAALQAEGD